MTSLVATRPDRPLTVPGRAETNTLLIRWRDQHDRTARGELIDRYMPLARRLAGRYAGQEPMEDLAHVAAVGLLGAIE